MVLTNALGMINLVEVELRRNYKRNGPCRTRMASRTGAKYVQVSAGNLHTCALVDNGSYDDWEMMKNQSPEPKWPNKKAPSTSRSVRVSYIPAHWWTMVLTNALAIRNMVNTTLNRNGPRRTRAARTKTVPSTSRSVRVLNIPAR